MPRPADTGSPDRSPFCRPLQDRHLPKQPKQTRRAPHRLMPPFSSRFFLPSDPRRACLFRALMPALRPPGQRNFLRSKRVLRLDFPSRSAPQKQRGYFPGRFLFRPGRATTGDVPMIRCFLYRNTFIFSCHLPLRVVSPTLWTATKKGALFKERPFFCRGPKGRGNHP